MQESTSYCIIYIRIIEHRLGQCDIGRVTVGNDAVNDQVRGAAGQTYLVAIKRVPSVFDNNIGVRLKDRDHLVGGWHRLAVNDSFFRLVDDTQSQINIVFQFVAYGHSDKSRLVF